MRKLPKLVAQTKVGKRVLLKIWRNQKLISKKVLLGRLESSTEFKAEKKSKPDKSKYKKIDNLKNNQDINKLKILLANETTAMLHGKTHADKAEKTAKNTFENKSIGDDLPSITFKKEKVINGINIIDLVLAANLSNSKSEVRRMIKNRGIKINNETIENDKFNVSLNNFDKKNFLKLSHGKKNHVILKVV